MARQPRLEFPGAVYHITSRGVARQNIFNSDADYRCLGTLLWDCAERFNWLVYAYCLMPNHYHLLLETPDGLIAGGMRVLNCTYGQRFNKAHDRVGHVFQGRYHAIVVDRESYLLEVSRYVVLNPVRAGLAPRPGDWRWSSYRATTGRVPKPKFLRSDWLLSQFSPKADRAVKAYESFVAAGVNSASPFEDLNGGIILGSDSFKTDFERQLSGENEAGTPMRLNRIIDRPPLTDIVKPDVARIERERQVYEAHIRWGYTLTEIADTINRNITTVSRMFHSQRERPRDGGKAQVHGKP